MALYRALFQKVINEKADVLLLGGDLCPGMFIRDKFISTQKKFLTNVLFPEVRELKEALPELSIFAILGNDDSMRCSLPLIDNPDIEYISMKEIALDNDLFLFGYPFCPFTPFAIKDFEKADSLQHFDSTPPGMLNGFRSTDINNPNDSFSEFSFGKDDFINNTIKQDLENFPFSSIKNTIAMFHSPPRGLFDMTLSGLRVGSESILNFIQDQQPLLTLHGHIHEGVENDGFFISQTGKSFSASVGSAWNNRFFCLIFSSNDIESIQRVPLL
ncbi:MAG: hypothetical protein GY754_05015 [bacterium]|nr:hypothetical protein [bacterium]